MEAEVFVHRLALNESESVGHGTRIWAFAHVMRGAVVGADCNIGDHAFIEGGAVIGNGVTIKNGVCIWDGVRVADHAFIGPGAMFTNDLYPRSPRAPVARDRYSKKEQWLVPTEICEGASIGASAVIRAGIAIGRYATIAAGATVTRSVPDFGLVAGNPARLIGHVCMCGRPLPKNLDCVNCNRVYEKSGDVVRLKRNPEDASR
jgi:acetyltransferase-like isoleucine patch superfamily enzyme